MDTEGRKNMPASSPPSYEESERLHQAGRLCYLVTALLCVVEVDEPHTGCSGCADCLAVRRVSTVRQARKIVSSAVLQGRVPVGNSCEPIRFTFLLLSPTGSPRLLRLGLEPLTRLSLPSPELFKRTSWTACPAAMLEATKRELQRGARTVESVWSPSAGLPRGGIRQLFHLDSGERSGQLVHALQHSQFAAEVIEAVDSAAEKRLGDLKASGCESRVLAYRHAILEAPQ